MVPDYVFTDRKDISEIDVPGFLEDMNKSSLSFWRDALTTLRQPILTTGKAFQIWPWQECLQLG